MLNIGVLKLIATQYDDFWKRSTRTIKYWSKIGFTGFIRMYLVRIMIISKFKKVFETKKYWNNYGQFAFITLEEENIIVNCRIYIY